MQNGLRFVMTHFLFSLRSLQPRPRCAARGADDDLVQCGGGDDRGCHGGGRLGVRCDGVVAQPGFGRDVARTGSAPTHAVPGAAAAIYRYNIY